jgi:tetratricopeptide (TPR) repeat protein
MQNNRTSWLFLVVVLFASAPALADTFEAWQAYYRGDFAKAEELAKPEAERGDSDAQYLMGLLNTEGDTGPRDDAAAAAWYRKSAEQGNLEAEDSLGYAYDFGLGVPKDRAQARLWYDKAAMMGTINARNNIAYDWAQTGERLDDALAYATEAVKADPKNAPYQDTLGWIYYRQKRFADSLPPLCRAASLWPEAPEIRSHLGDALWHAGLAGPARHQWQEAMDLAQNPGSLNQESRDFLQAEGVQNFESAMKRKLEEGPGDGPLPDPSQMPALSPDALEDCKFSTS